MQNLKIKNCQGVTLIEALVSVGLVSMIVFSLYLALFNVTKLFADAKQKTVATALANERMEIIRNLEYDEIGVQGFIPSGPLLQSENISKNGFIYTVETSVGYVDDVFDGEGAADPIETDYKQARVKINWTANGKAKHLEFFSKFVPEGLETNVGGGVLSINAVDSGGNLVPTVTVRIDSVQDTPAVHGTVISDGEGNVRLPGMPEQEYKITVSKTGYETVETYAEPPTSAFTPLDGNISAVAGYIVMKTIVINKSADLTIQARNISDDSDIEGIGVELLGGRKIGISPDTYNLDSNETTNSGGIIEYAGISPGSYNIANLALLDTLTLKYVGSDSEFPIQLACEDDKTVQLVFAEKSADSLFIMVKDSSTADLISGANVHVTGTGFDQTVTTGVDGMVYFPDPEDPPVTMAPGEYTIEITAGGYSNYSDTETVANLIEHEALLLP